MTLLRRTSQCTVPADARAAPTSPPMSACEDDDGNPKYQVIRFQAIAPTRAEKMRTRPSWPEGVPMMPLPTVFATFVEMKAPARLKAAAMASAMRGVSARVDTVVAIALAAS